MPQQFDAELVALADDLLHNDPRLIAAAALESRVAVVVSEPKPERKRKPRTSAKLPPPRIDTPDARTDAERAAEVAEAMNDEPAPASTGAPWLKVARPFVVGDHLRAVLGDKYLAGVRVDGGLWAKLRAEDQRRAMALALRQLVWLDREDGSDAVKIERPPLQCHPDTAEDLSHLVAALGVDGAEGAAAVSAAERLGENPTDEDCALASERCDNAHLRDMLGDVLRAVHAAPEFVGNLIEVLGPSLAERCRDALGGPLPGHFIHEDGEPAAADANEVCA